MNSNMRGSLEMTAAMIISGTIGWFVVMSGRPVAEVVFWRCLFGAVILLTVCGVMGFLRRGAVTRRQLALASLGGVAIVANWLLLFAAYSRASISISTVVYNTQPFMLVGLGVLFLGERMTPAKLAWLLLSFVGLILIVSERPDSGGGAYMTGVLMALGAAFFYALAAIITKALKGMPPHLIALVQVIVGAVLLLPFALNSSGAIKPESWTVLVTMGVVHTGLMYILLYGAIQRLPTYLTGTLSFIYPIVAILVDVLAFGHRLHWIQLVGAAAILFAAAGMLLGLTARRSSH